MFNNQKSINLCVRYEIDYVRVYQVKN